MKRAEYQRLRKETKMRYNKAIQAAEEEQVKSLMAIDKVRKMMSLSEDEPERICN